MHILIVEDDPSIREMLAAILEEEGHTVATAGQGQEALDYLSRAAKHPDIILLDLMMPVMTGWQFREAQRHIPALANIPVLVLSAKARLRAEAAQLDAAAIITKPIDVAQLLATIQRWA